MEDISYFDERPTVEDDYELLFRPVEERGAVESGEPARIWRVYIAKDGDASVSSAMTLASAREFAATLRNDGFAVLRIMSAERQVVEGDEMFRSGFDGDLRGATEHPPQAA